MDHVERHRKLKKATRVMVVIVTWGVVALIPDQSSSFFEGVIVAAVASVGEYFSMVLDEEDPWRFWLNMFGLFISCVYFAIGIMGLGGQITLNVDSREFSFGKSIPLPHASSDYWSYYWSVGSFLIYVIIPVFESVFLKPVQEKSSQVEKIPPAPSASVESIGGVS